MSKRLRCACVALACLAGFSGAARAEDEEIHVTTQEEFAKEAGFSLAGSDETTAEHPEPLMGHKNESPGDVRAEIADLNDQKMVSDFLEPAQAVVVDLQLKVAYLRLDIAERREKRDALRKQGKKVQAEKVEREIHQIKQKLAVLVPKKSVMANLLKPDGDGQ